MASKNSDPNFMTVTPLPTMTVGAKDGREAAELDRSEIPARVLDPLHVDMAKMTPVPLLRLTLKFSPDTPPARAAAEVDAICREVDRTERRLGGSGLDWRMTADEVGCSMLLTFRPLHLEEGRTAERLGAVARLLNAGEFGLPIGGDRCSAELSVDGS